MEDIIAVGKRIKQLRVEKLKISQGDFANSLGMDRTFLSRVESGKQNLTIKSLSLICKKFGLSLQDFFADLPGGEE